MIEQIKDQYHSGTGFETLVREIGMGIFPSKAALQGLPRTAVVRPEVLRAMAACFAGTSDRVLMEKASEGMGYIAAKIAEEDRL